MSLLRMFLVSGNERGYLEALWDGFEQFGTVGDDVGLGTTSDDWGEGLG